MAQAKTKASKKRSQSSQRPKKAQSRSKSSSASRSSNGQARNGKTRIEAARQTVESSTKEAGQAVTKVASKAKTPLLAGSAALAGAAGGLAIGAMRSRQSHSHKVLGMKMPQGVKFRSRDVAKAAKEVGTFGQHVGELASELRHAREDSGGDGKGKHRSRVVVVLDGLPARR